MVSTQNNNSVEKEKITMKHNAEDILLRMGLFSSMDVIDEENEEIIEEQTRLFSKGIAEAGLEYDKYFYVSADRFLKEVTTLPQDRTIYWNKGWRKASTDMPLWIVGYGAAK